MWCVAAEGQEQWEERGGRMGRAAALCWHSVLVDIRRQLGADIKTLLRCHLLARACLWRPSKWIRSPSSAHSISSVTLPAATPLR